MLRVLDLAVVNSSQDDPIDVYAAMRGMREELPRPSLGQIYTNRLLQPAITRTCRLLREEGLRVYYSHNTFILSARDGATLSFSCWLGRLPKDQLANVTVLAALPKPGLETSRRGASWHLGGLALSTDEAMEGT